MREVKFRAWDKKNEKMLAVVDAESMMFAYGNNYDHLPWVGEYGNRRVDAVIMQYTGLKDNTKWDKLTVLEQSVWIAEGNTMDDWNGREIYEGDIVTFKGVRRLPERLVVIWGDDGFEIADEGGRGSWYVKPSSTTGTWGDDCEVLGSIYENPELVKLRKAII